MSLSDFTKRAAVVAGIALLAGALAAFLWVALYGLLVLFAAVLFATTLDGLAGMVANWTRLPRGMALTATAAMIALVVGGVLLAGGLRAAKQAPELQRNLQDSLGQIEGKLHAFGLGTSGAQPGARGNGLLPSPSDLLQHLNTYLSTSVSLATDVVVIVVAGFYFAAGPRQYIEALIRLAPPDRRARLRTVSREIGHALRRWLAGRFASMVAVGILTTVGLLALHVKLALLLGFIAAALTFLPYLGTIISLVPALLLALLSGPMTAVYVVLLYLVAHTLEGYILSPLIQERAVHLAPGWLITSQLLGALVAGIYGIVLATPLLVVLTVCVQMLYIEDVLGDSVHVLGE